MTRPTLVFDLDGTLVDSVPDLAASLNRVMVERGLGVFSAAEVTAMVGDGARVLVRRALKARGLGEDEAVLAAFLDDYGANAAVATCPYPDVPETLQALRAAGWRLAVCTNKPIAPARDLLAALGMAELFAAVGGGDSYPIRKPDPGHLLATLAEAGGDPARAVMVGDHHNDVAAAMGAAIPAIFALWGYGTPEMGEHAAAKAIGFAEIPALAEQVLGSP